jgi:hypothetical protein
MLAAGEMWPSIYSLGELLSIMSFGHMPVDVVLWAMAKGCLSASTSMVLKALIIDIETREMRNYQIWAF